MSTLVEQSLAEQVECRLLPKNLMDLVGLLLFD